MNVGDMENDPLAHEFGFDDWLKMEAMTWTIFGLLSAVATAIGTENAIRWATVLTGVFVAGIIVWAARSGW